MRRAFLAAMLLLVLTQLPLLAQGGNLALRLAQTPPMGWNSWDSYGLTITEAEYKANADWMDQHLKTFGWQYAVIDEGWYLQNPESGGKPAWQYTLDKEGRFIPAANRFPSAANDQGFKLLADYVHSRGLKMGVHIIRGIPREAVAKNLPIAGSSYHAADAADTSDTCFWNPDTYGVKNNAAGQAYYDSVAHLYAGWGLDFIKVDCISTLPYKTDEIHMISSALARSGRPIVLSLSPGPTSLAVALDVSQHAQMWRISQDFWDFWKPLPDKPYTQTLYGQFATAAAWALYIGPGHWPDADMLPVGFIGPRTPLDSARPTRFTRDEQRTLLTFWSIIRSPLMLGCDLTRSDDWTTQLLSNPEVIAVDQHSIGNRPLITTNGPVIWSATAGDGKGHYLAVFNRMDIEQKFAMEWNELGLLSHKAYKVRDLWEQKDLGPATSLQVTLQPHACVLYRASE